VEGKHERPLTTKVGQSWMKEIGHRVSAGQFETAKVVKRVVTAELGQFVTAAAYQEVPAEAWQESTSDVDG
jgi:hypothetical protein